jgi:SAM-dependent methyltransferase
MGKSKKNRPVLINLGCNRHASPGFTHNVDLYPFPGVDTVCNLEKPWPFESDYADRIVAVDLIEHLHDPIHVMNEAWRVLKDGGIFEILVPSTDGRGWSQDPTHVSFWNINSFFYYAVFKQEGTWVSHPWRTLYAPHLIKAAFDVMPPAAEVAQTDPDAMGIVYVKALLVAVKAPIFTSEGLPEEATAPREHGQSLLRPVAGSVS